MSFPLASNLYGARAEVLLSAEPTFERIYALRRARLAFSRALEKRKGNEP